jgi:hypothetical protein
MCDGFGTFSISFTCHHLIFFLFLLLKVLWKENDLQAPRKSLQSDKITDRDIKKWFPGSLYEHFEKCATTKETTLIKMLCK